MAAHGIGRSIRRKALPSGTNVIVAGPDSGVKDIPENGKILHAGKKLKCLTAAGDHHGQNLLAAVIEIRAVCHFLQRIEAAAFLILFQIIVGVHDVDEFTEIEAHVTKRLLPFVLVDGKQLCHNIAEISGNQVYVGGI